MADRIAQYFIKRADAWLRDQLVSIDNPLGTTRTTPYWEGFPEEIVRGIGLDPADNEPLAHSIIEELEASGDWDRLPSVGPRPERWYHAPTVTGEMVPVSSTDKADGLRALELADSDRYDWLIRIGEPSRAEVMDVAARYKVGHISRLMRYTDIKVSQSAVQLVHVTLASHYLPNAGLSLMSYAEIAEATGLSMKVVGNAARVLSENGFWGVVRGRNGFVTRFYPLFIDLAIEQFSERIR